ncbi:MAG: hypothetical protein AAGI23_05165 [Bacteroidota bacterium]
MMKAFSLTLLLIGACFFAQAQDEKSAADLYNDGVALLKAKDYAAALPAFEGAIAKAEAAEEGDSTSMQVLELSKKNGVRAAYYLGNSQRKAKAYDDALATFEKGLAMGDFYALYLGKAQALDKAGKDKEAAEAYLAAGEKYIAAGQDEEKALKLYRSGFLKIARMKDHNLMIEKILAHPVAAKNGDVSYYVAKAYMKKGDASTALQHAQAATAAAIAEEDKLGKFYMLEGEVYTAMGNDAAALEAYKKVPTSGKYGERAAYFIGKLGG